MGCTRRADRSYGKPEHPEQHPRPSFGRAAYLGEQVGVSPPL